MQVNIKRGESVHDFALALAYKEGIDIMLIQQTLIGGDLKRKLFKRHKSYTTYVLSKKWKDCPIVITHICR